MRKSEWVIGLVYLGVLAVLPLAGHWARRGADRSCAYDGGKIEPVYRVRIVDGQGRDFEFCCIRCAERWLGREKSAPRAVHVTDEVSGEVVEASRAFFVRSLVVTNAMTGNRVHAFRTARDAENHARASRGRLLDDAERPFGCCTPQPASWSPR
jgi:hypothetical protein